MVVVLSVGGCAGSGSTKNLSPTGGVSLAMLVEQGAGSAALYRVAPDGTFSFGGGQDARAGKTTWSGRMTAEEIQELLATLEACGWFQTEPASTGEPGDHRYRLRLTTPESRRSFDVTGDSDAVTPLHDVLERISRRRLDTFLERLPKAGPQRQRPG